LISLQQLPPDAFNNVNLNFYQQKKSMAQGMLDLALLSANANQLRYVLDSNQRNHYFYVSLTLISISLVLQVLVAIALVFKSRYNIENELEYANADKINNFIMIGILLITIANVISSAFAPQS
jgi:Ninjurin